MKRDEAILAFASAGHRPDACIKLADELIKLMEPSRLDKLIFDHNVAMLDLADIRKLAEARKDALVAVMKIVDTKKIDYTLLQSIKTELT